MAIFVGLPLMAWGIRDARGFLGHPARLGYVALVILLQVVVLALLPEVGHGQAKEKVTLPLQRLALTLLQILPLALVIAAPYGDRRDVGVFSELSIIRYLGLVMFALGFAAMHWAEVALGKQFSVTVTIQPAHSLVTRGPYRYVRHPRYLGVLVFTAGFALVYRSWLGLILVTVLAGVLAWRIHDEEELMHSEFGTTWEAYARRTWRLVPFVY
ncbi:MAG TPA: isoprenylcysteine carboxylmethyltransferase family protein [Dongiaceae bacterium]|nr:conserved membrane hypothetical protein [Verrucomicrobiota bacterium]HXP59972.1 isoprenylcysteine carboxylmethyltransferase family protein [Dongiaceae bacterium]